MELKHKGEVATSGINTPVLRNDLPKWLHARVLVMEKEE